MIGFFPKAYPDELLHSLYARYYAHSGYAAYADVLRELFGGIKNSIDFTPGLTPAAKKVLEKSQGHSIEWIIENNTLFKHYARFITAEAKQRAMKQIIEGNGQFRNVLPMPHDVTTYIRYCPLCANEDREQYGETYWHRKHQLPNLPICYKHGTLLCNTDIRICGKTTPRLFVAEFMVSHEVGDVIKVEENLVGLSKYVSDLIDSKLNYDDVPQAGDILRRHLYPPYVNSWRDSVELKVIAEKMADYYKNDNSIEILNQVQIYKVFYNKRRNPISVCQIANFLHIPVEDMVFPESIEQSREQVLSEIVTIMHKEHSMPYEVIADAVQIPLEDIKIAAKRNYNKPRHRKPGGGHGGPRALDWNKLDIEMQPLVQEAASQIYGGNDGRPHRVAVSAIEAKLSMPEGRLKNMPKCMEIIDKYKETIEEYWVREVVWCVNVIEKSNTPLVWNRIRELINIDKKNFLRILPLLRQKLSEGQIELLTSGFKI